MNRLTKIILASVVLIVIASVIGWLIGRGSVPIYNNNSSNPSSTTKATSTDVSSLVSYTLPNGWADNSCSVSPSIIYVNPTSTYLDCNLNPSAPIKIYVDPQNITDCQQLMPSNNQGIKKHICISLYIDGHKSLKASTEYSSNSSYKIDTTISDYFINTGKGVVDIEYIYTSANNFQAGFDQLATSVSVK